jgi:hypothetical protein
LAALVLIAMVTLLSACGSSAPANTSVGNTATNNTATNNTAANNTAAKVEEAVKFAECMRNNGVSDFPDPDASGQFAYGIKAGSSLDPSTVAWQQAISACKNLEPPGFIPTSFTSQQIVARLKFAQCMRANGVPDFPDPSNSGPLIDVQHGQSNPEIQSALQKCRPLLAAASGGQ